MTKITLARNLNNQLYGGNAYETTRMEVTVEGDDVDALRQEAKDIIDEWTDLLIREIEIEEWGITPEEWEKASQEAKSEFKEASRAVSRSRYHKQKAQKLMQMGLLKNNNF
mgnify:FL=1